MKNYLFGWNAATPNFKVVRSNRSQESVRGMVELLGVWKATGLNLAPGRTDINKKKDEIPLGLVPLNHLVVPDKGDQRKRGMERERERERMSPGLF